MKSPKIKTLNLDKEVMVKILNKLIKSNNSIAQSMNALALSIDNISRERVPAIGFEMPTINTEEYLDV